MQPSQIKSSRDKYRISLTELAAVTGLLPDYLEKIEEGIAHPTASDLDRIARAFQKIKKLAKESDAEGVIDEKG